MKDQRESTGFGVDVSKKPVNDNTQEMARHSDDNTSVLKESGNMEIKMNTNNIIICELHESGDMFCSECKRITCTRCETVHKNHALVKFSEASVMFKLKLNSELLKVRNFIKYSSIVKKDLHSYIEKLGVNLAEITQAIIERASGLPEGTEVLTEMLIGDVETEHQTELSRIKTKMSEFDTFINNAKTVAVNCEHLINAADDTYVIRKGHSALTNVSNLMSVLPLCPDERCIYILSSVQQVKEGETLAPEEMLGQFIKENVPWRIEVRRIGSYKPETLSSSRFVTTMCAGDNESVWVVWQWGPLIHLIDKEGNVKKTVDAGVKVDDICTDLNGNLVASCHEARCVKVFDSNYEVAKTMQMEKVPRGVRVSSKNEMVMCCVQNLHHKKGDHSSVFKVNIDSSDITDLSSTDCFVQPWRIAVNMNGDICVSDRNKGMVIILDSKGGMKSNYSGPEGDTRHPFAPHGICCDNYGQIYVVDYSNHTVHVLDPLGRFRGFLIMDSELEKRAIFMGTSAPFSMAIDTGGDIWVGNKFGYLTVLKHLQ